MPPDETLPGNDPHLTPAEQAALDAEKADADGGAPDSGADPATPPTAAAADPDPAAATPPAEPAPAAEPTPAPAAETGPPPGTVFPQIAVGEARDFDKELGDLKAKYRADEIDDDEYEDQRASIILARAKAEVRAEMSGEFQQQSWENTVQVFLSQPENALLLRDEHMKALWQSSINAAAQTAANEGRALTDWQMLSEGRALLFKTIGIAGGSAIAPDPAPAAPAASPKPPVSPPPLNRLPPDIGSIPGAAPSGALETAESLAALDIQDLEARMAGMSEDQQQQILRTVAGAFIDD